MRHGCWRGAGGGTSALRRVSARLLRSAVRSRSLPFAYCSPPWIRSQGWGFGLHRETKSRHERKRRCVAAGRALESVRKRHAKTEGSLESALAALAAALDASKANWMIIGGIALVARGVQRLTFDIDATVQGDQVGAKALLDTFQKHAILPRIADSLRFAQENLILLVRHTPSGIDLDVSLAWSGFELEALRSRTFERIGDVRLPVAAAEDLVIFKLIASRPKDVEDAASLLVLHADLDVGRIRTRLTALAELVEDDSVVRTLDTILARLRHVQRAPRVGASTQLPGKPRRRTAPAKLKTASAKRKAAPPERKTAPAKRKTASAKRKTALAKRTPTPQKRRKK